MFCEVYLDLILFNNENRYLTPLPQKKVILFLFNLTFQAPPPTPIKTIFNLPSPLLIQPPLFFRIIWPPPLPPLLNFLENFNSFSIKRGVGRGAPHYVFGIISWRYAPIQRDASEMAFENTDDFNSQLKREKKKRTKKKKKN